MGALTLAGHETTANTLTWLLWELSKHPQFQDRLREEIRDKREEINLKDIGAVAGSRDFSMDDLESMPFLQAVLKAGSIDDGEGIDQELIVIIQEVLRFHPIVYHLMRAAKKDDVIPLSEPITTSNGEVVDHVSVAKDQTILVSICAYNRLAGSLYSGVFVVVYVHVTQHQENLGRRR